MPAPHPALPYSHSRSSASPTLPSSWIHPSAGAIPGVELGIQILPPPPIRIFRLIRHLKVDQRRKLTAIQKPRDVAVAKHAGERVHRHALDTLEPRLATVCELQRLVDDFDIDQIIEVGLFKLVFCQWRGRERSEMRTLSQSINPPPPFPEPPIEPDLIEVLGERFVASTTSLRGAQYQIRTLSTGSRALPELVYKLLRVRYCLCARRQLAPIILGM